MRGEIDEDENETLRYENETLRYENEDENETLRYETPRYKNGKCRHRHYWLCYPLRDRLLKG